MSEVLKYAEHGVVSWPEYEQMQKDRDEARDLARRYYRTAWFLAVQIRRDTGQGMEHTEAEIERLASLNQWVRDDDDQQ